MRLAKRCVASGLVQGDHLSVDGSFIQADANNGSRIPREELSEAARVNRNVQQYLDDLQRENPVEAEPHQQDKMSTTDPDADLFQQGRQSADARLFRQLLIDNSSCVVVGVEATDARPSQEIASARRMLADCAHRFGLTPKTLAADTGYGKADFLAWLEAQGIASYIPLRKHFPSADRHYGMDHFTYHPETNSYQCPEGKELKYRGIKPAVNRSHLYRSTEAQCRGCSRKTECTSGRYKQLVIHVEEDVRQRARQRTQEPAFFPHQRDRRKVEALFGELKNRIGLRRVRLRRLKHVREQFLMAATAQNLKRLVRHLAKVSPTPPESFSLQTRSREMGIGSRCGHPRIPLTLLLPVSFSTATK